jgi:hypothetical protein
VTSERPERDPSDRPASEPSPDAAREGEPETSTPAETEPGSPGSVSGHRVPVRRPGSTLDAPEHDWTAARERVFPLLHPPETHGIPFDWVRERATFSGPASHTQPLVGDGPAGLKIVYAIAAAGFDVIVNGDHLLSWGIGAVVVDEAARKNLAGWSAAAGWTDETSGNRRLLSSDSGEGYDATRILLPEVRTYLASELTGGELAPGTRVLVGLPERHLLVAGSLQPDDPEFVELFREFVVDHSAAAEEPIDRRLFELSGGKLQPFEEGG